MYSSSCHSPAIFCEMSGVSSLLPGGSSCHSPAIFCEMSGVSSLLPKGSSCHSPAIFCEMSGVSSLLPKGSSCHSPAIFCEMSGVSSLLPKGSSCHSPAIFCEMSGVSSLLPGGSSCHGPAIFCEMSGVSSLLPGGSSCHGPAIFCEMSGVSSLLPKGSSCHGLRYILSLLPKGSSCHSPAIFCEMSGVSSLLLKGSSCHSPAIFCEMSGVSSLFLKGSSCHSPAIFCEMSGVSSLLPGAENAPWMSVTGLVSVSLLVTSVLLVAVCVCCRRTKGFQVLARLYCNQSSPMASLVLTDSSQLTSHSQHLGIYSSPMASLVLTDSSQLTSHSQHLGRVTRHDETDALLRVRLGAGERQYETNWSVNALDACGTGRDCLKAISAPANLVIKIVTDVISLPPARPPIECKLTINCPDGLRPSSRFPLSSLLHGLMGPSIIVNWFSCRRELKPTPLVPRRSIARNPVSGKYGSSVQVLLEVVFPIKHLVFSHLDLKAGL
uniref:Uncharacterized protein n=1 Tax=Timema douglasi TaxID=61478 RepID=A0A7R8VQ25_TIMDO|nr:unnamed protein product [Timema douglasi]